METITLSVNKTAIGIALVVGLIVGGAIGCMIGAHHSRYEGRGQFQGNYGQMRNVRPMMDKATMGKMMEAQNTNNATVEATVQAKPVQ